MQRKVTVFHSCERKDRIYCYTLIFFSFWAVQAAGYFTFMRCDVLKIMFMVIPFTWPFFGAALITMDAYQLLQENCAVFSDLSFAAILLLAWLSIYTIGVLFAAAGNGYKSYLVGILVVITFLTWCCFSGVGFF